MLHNANRLMARQRVNQMSPALMSVDGPKLKSVFEKNETTQALLNYLNERKRNTPMLDLRRAFMEMLRKGQALEYVDLIQAVKGLEDLGIGTYYKGRGVNPDTFAWKYSLKLITEAATKGTVAHIPNMIEKHKEELRQRAKERAEQLRAEKNKDKKFYSAPTAKTNKLASFKASPAPVAKKTKSGSDQTQTIHVFLGDGNMFAMTLPANLSKEDARKICQSVSHVAE